MMSRTGRAAYRWRVLIADDHAIVREGLKQIISSDPAFMVVSDVGTAGLALQRGRAGGIDIVLLDISLPDRNGLELLKQLKQEIPVIKVLICTLHRENAYAVRALRAGAAGYLSKQCAPETLITALHQVALGRKYISPELAQVLADQVGNEQEIAPHQRLSDREYQTLLKISAGMTVTDIAAELSLSAKTISMYRTRLLQKMHMRTNAELMHYTLRHQLLPELVE